MCVCGSYNLWRISSILILLFLSPSSSGSSSCSSCLLFPWSLFYFTCIGDFPACITCVQCPERPEESIPGLELQLGCKSPHGCWKLNLGRLEEQNPWAFSPALLTITFLIWKHFFCPLKSLLKTASCFKMNSILSLISNISFAVFTFCRFLLL